MTQENPPAIKTGYKIIQGGRHNTEDRINVRFAESDAKKDLPEFDLHTKGGLSLKVGIVADGIGGGPHGELAAQRTVDTIVQVIQQSQKTETKLIDLLIEAIETANLAVIKDAKHPQNKGMGSTVAVAAITKNSKLYIANLGDSRIYLLRGGDKFQLTRDHNWGNQMVLNRVISRREADLHPRNEELLRSIGYQSKIKVDVGIYGKLDPQKFDSEDAFENEGERIGKAGIQLRENDRIVLCTDGLIKSHHTLSNFYYVSEDELSAIVRAYEPPNAANMLTQLAESRDVDDNASVIIFEMPNSARIPLKREIDFGTSESISIPFLDVGHCFFWRDLFFNFGLLSFFRSS